MPENLHQPHTDFQTLLEHHRRDPDDEHLWQSFRETRERIERAWLQKALELPDAGA